MKLFIFQNVTVSTRYHGRGSWAVVAYDQTDAVDLLVRAVAMCDAAVAADEDKCHRPWDWDDGYWSSLIASEVPVAQIPARPKVDADELRAVVPSEYELANARVPLAIYQFPNAGCC